MYFLVQQPCFCGEKILVYFNTVLRPDKTLIRVFYGKIVQYIDKI